MKRILSTWMAAAKTIFWKLLLILLLLAGTELLMLRHGMDWYRQMLEDGYMPITFSNLLDQSKLAMVYFGALVAVTAVCCLQGAQFSGKKVYTLQRLPLGEFPTTLLWALVHLSAYMILWAVQLAMIFVLWRVYVTEFGSGNPGLELFVAFYQNGFLHGLLPLADVARWIMVGFYYVTLAYSSACFGFFHRRGKVRLWVCVLLVLYGFLVGSDGSDVGNFLICVSCVLLAVSQTGSIWGVYHNAETD